MPLYGETRADGYRFKGYRNQNGKRYEHWLSPQAWSNKQKRLSHWKRKTYADNVDAMRAQGRVYMRASRRLRPAIHTLVRARCRAKAQGLPFTITAADIVIPEFCPVFGVPLRVGDGDCAPELDRIDNTKGYVPGNVIVVSSRANRLKRDATLAELQTLVYFYENLL